MSAALLAGLAKYAEEQASGLEAVSPERRQALQQIAAYVQSRFRARESARLLFVCTHNSRRSHMAQIWAGVAAFRRGLGRVETFSGGTEVTALAPPAVEALRRAGFAIERLGEGDNPRYGVTFSVGAPPMEVFSKMLDDPANPHGAFCAVMTCNTADEACPVVPGADQRVSLPFEDPKLADGRPGESATYDERCAQIASEMLHAFSLVEDS